MMSRNSWLRQGLGLLFLIVVAGYLWQSHAVEDFIASAIYDSVIHHTACADMPTVEAADAIVAQHQAELDAVNAIDPGRTWYEYNRSACEGKRAEITFFYTGHTHRLTIEKMVGSKTFHGIPFNMINN